MKTWSLCLLIAVLAIVAIILLVGEKPFIPEKEEFDRIRSLPYDKETMNCVQKSTLYASVLREREWKCWVVIGAVEGVDLNTGHTWVVVEDKKGVRRLCDPTLTVGIPSGYAEKYYKEYKPVTYCGEGVEIGG